MSIVTFPDSRQQRQKILNWMVAGIIRISSALNSSANTILICPSRFRTSELRCIFREFVRSRHNYLKNWSKLFWTRDTTMHIIGQKSLTAKLLKLHPYAKDSLTVRFTLDITFRPACYLTSFRWRWNTQMDLWRHVEVEDNFNSNWHKIIARC